MPDFIIFNRSKDTAAVLGVCLEHDCPAQAFSDLSWGCHFEPVTQSAIHDRGDLDAFAAVLTDRVTKPTEGALWIHAIHDASRDLSHA